jgi:hypothetical protein
MVGQLIGGEAVFTNTCVSRWAVDGGSTSVMGSRSRNDYFGGRSGGTAEGCGFGWMPNGRDASAEQKLG